MFYHLRLDPSGASRFNCAEIDNNVGYRCETLLHAGSGLEPFPVLVFVFSSSLFLFAFFFATHPQPEWMLMDVRAITSEPRDLTPSSEYGCNLLHLRSAFSPMSSKRLHRERNERIARFVFFFNGPIDITAKKIVSDASTLRKMHHTLAEIALNILLLCCIAKRKNC